MFKAFYETLQVPIFVIDTNNKIVFANSSVEELLGHSAKTLMSVRLVKFVHKDFQVSVQAACDVVFDEGVGAEQKLSNLTFVKKSGRRVKVDLCIKHFRFNKEPCAVITLHDLSELVKYQEEKAAYMRELSHASKLADIGRLTAGVAHELNNPLMIIQGFAESIQDTLNKGPHANDDLFNQVEPIVRAVDRMAKIIKTMMRLSRNDEIFMVHVDLSEVLEDVLRFLGNQLRPLGIQVLRETPLGLGIVKCDPSQIEQIILNIFNNAIHALEKNKEGDRQLRLKLYKNKKKINLTIWNNGPAIPREIKERIMTPFFTTKSVGEGTGLGLYLSHGIMKAHDGDLTFESSKKLGTEFNLSFPEVDVNSMSNSFFEKRTVLVVDDEEFILELLAQKFQRLGFDVLQAKDGPEALEVLRRNLNIDCVFTDIRMPKMDGVKFIKEVRQFNQSILIYVISGHVNKSTIEAQSQELGINGFMAKPIDHRVFSSIVYEIQEALKYKDKVRGQAA